jgi:type II secretory pathway pseudopilin PulG
MRRPGFTVVEVVIVTLFVTFCYYAGTWSYDWYTRSSRASTAEAFLQALADAQQDYKKKTGRYLSLHGSKLDAYPKEVPAEGFTIESLPKEFEVLGKIAAPESPFFFRVAVLAGVNDASFDEMLQGSALDRSKYYGSDPWFYIVAFADQDGDGEFSKIEIASWDDNGVVSTARTE